MITVCLYGDLATQGRRFRLHADTPAEALRALFVQIDGLREKIRDGVFQVRFNRKDYGEEDVKQDFAKPSSGVLHIVPRVAGAAKNPTVNIIIGVVLVIASAYVGGSAGWGWFAAGGVKMAVAQTAMSMGLSLALTGISQKLARPPAVKEAEKDSKNTSFSQLENTAAQGNPVPVAYGLVYAGSRVASVGIRTARIRDLRKELMEAYDKFPGIGKRYKGISKVFAKAKYEYEREKFIALAMAEIMEKRRKIDAGEDVETPDIAEELGLNPTDGTVAAQVPVEANTPKPLNPGYSLALREWQSGYDRAKRLNNFKGSFDDWYAATYKKPLPDWYTDYTSQLAKQAEKKEAGVNERVTTPNNIGGVEFLKATDILVQADQTPNSKLSSFVIHKTYVPGIAAKDRNGNPFNTDFTNEAVISRNYIAKYKAVKPKEE